MSIIKQLNSPSSAARDISHVVKAPFRRHHLQQRRARAAKTAEMPFPPPKFGIDWGFPLSMLAHAEMRWKLATNFALSRRHQP